MEAEEPARGRKASGLKTNGRRIALLRKQEDWSQEELAGQAGLSTKTIVRAEAGQSIDVESIEMIAKVLHTHKDALIADEEFTRGGVQKDRSYVEVSIKVYVDRDITGKATELRALLASIERVITGGQGSTTLLEAKMGSLVLVALMQREDAEDFIASWRRGGAYRDKDHRGMSNLIQKLECEEREINSILALAPLVGNGIYQGLSDFIYAFTAAHKLAGELNTRIKSIEIDPPTPSLTSTADDLLPES